MQTIRVSNITVEYIKKLIIKYKNNNNIIILYFKEDGSLITEIDYKIENPKFIDNYNIDNIDKYLIKKIKEHLKDIIFTSELDFSGNYCYKSFSQYIESCASLKKEINKKIKLMEKKDKEIKLIKNIQLEVV